MGRKQDHILDGDSYLSIALCHISFFKRRKSPVFQDSPRNFRFEGSILCSPRSFRKERCVLETFVFPLHFFFGMYA